MSQSKTKDRQPARLSLPALDAKCYACKKTFGERYKKKVSCQGCNAVYHVDCSKCLALLPTGAFARCCAPASQFNLDDFGNSLLRSFAALLEAKLAPLHDSVSDLTHAVEGLGTRLSSIEELNVGPRLAALETCNKEIEASQAASLENVLQEGRERERRSRNIIVLKFNERADEAEDLATFSSLLDKVGSYPLPIEAKRLGKSMPSPNKPRPLLLSFITADETKIILRDSATIKRRLNIIVKSDQTPQQQQHLVNIRAQLQQRLLAGETGLTIRYIKGVPQITMMQKNTESRDTQEGQTEKSVVESHDENNGSEAPAENQANPSY